MSNETTLRKALEECADTLAVLLAQTSGRHIQDAWGSPIDITDIQLAHVAALLALRNAK